MAGKLRLRRAAQLATLSLSLCIFTAAPHHALASYGACRSDPYMLLSNTAQLDLSASINDSTSDVKSINYVVYGPAGTKPLLVVPTDSLLGLTEHFTYYATEPAGTYDTYTTVVTGQKGISVTASSWIVSLSTLSLPSVSGYSSQALHIHLAPLHLL